MNKVAWNWGGHSHALQVAQTEHKGAHLPGFCGEEGTPAPYVATTQSTTQPHPKRRM